MYIMFIDEFGDSRNQSGDPDLQNYNDQPFIIISGIIIPIQNLSGLTKDMMDAKKHFFPGLVKRDARKYPLNWLRTEIKGATLKKASRDSNIKLIRHQKKFFKKIFSLLSNSSCKLVSHTYIKPHDKKISFENIYTSAVQLLAEEFDIFLNEVGGKGMIILDSRDHHKDKQVCYSLVTRIHNRGKDRYPNIIEVPTFLWA